MIFRNPKGQFVLLHKMSNQSSCNCTLFVTFNHFESENNIPRCKNWVEQKHIVTMCLFCPFIHFCMQWIILKSWLGNSVFGFINLIQSFTALLRYLKQLEAFCRFNEKGCLHAIPLLNASLVNVDAFQGLYTLANIAHWDQVSSLSDSVLSGLFQQGWGLQFSNTMLVVCCF